MEPTASRSRCGWRDCAPATVAATVRNSRGRREPFGRAGRRTKRPTAKEPDVGIELGNGAAVPIQQIMAISLFSLGVLACLAGIWTVLAREYQQALKGLSAQSSRLHARALTEVGVVPAIDAAARLVEAVNQLVRTAMGVGAFLCLIGLALCVLAYIILAA
jgi:hypothetical protein